MYSLKWSGNPLLIFLLYSKKAKREIFGPRHRPLANKPKPLHILMSLEITLWWLDPNSGTHTLCFSWFKGHSTLTLVNLLDNCIPLVVSIYSITFKSNTFADYQYARVCIQLMFFLLQ